MEEDRLWALMAACDVCVNLRSPTMGETSGSVIRQLSLGKPVVVSDVGWFAELPDEVALKVPVDEREVETLHAALELLARDEQVRGGDVGGGRASSSAASTTSSRVAELYAAALEQAAGGEAVADAVLGEVARAAAEVGIEPGSPEAAELARRLAEVELGRIRCARRVPPWGWLAAIVVALVRAPRVARARDARPVHHGRRADLLGARAQLRGGRRLPGPRRAGDRLQPRLPAPDQPGLRALRRAAGRVRGREDAQRARSCRSRPCPPTCSRAGCSPPPLSLVAAVLAVALPSLVYTGTVMTENVFYPLFLTGALAARARARAADARRRQVGLLALVGALLRDARAGGRVRAGDRRSRRSCSRCSAGGRCARR